jgi:hypothetical protein
MNEIEAMKMISNLKALAKKRHNVDWSDADALEALLHIHQVSKTTGTLDDRYILLGIKKKVFADILRD